ncbi:MAG: hypothetical protein LBT20_00260 [Clostridiales bacterium]|nr:hypothetical protein [Clostridiales bacterium]
MAEEKTSGTAKTATAQTKQEKSSAAAVKNDGEAIASEKSKNGGSIPSEKSAAKENQAVGAEPKAKESSSSDKARKQKETAAIDTERKSDRKKKKKHRPLPNGVLWAASPSSAPVFLRAGFFTLIMTAAVCGIAYLILKDYEKAIFLWTALGGFGASVLLNLFHSIHILRTRYSVDDELIRRKNGSYIYSVHIEDVCRIKVRKFILTPRHGSIRFWSSSGKAYLKIQSISEPEKVQALLESLKHDVETA